MADVVKKEEQKKMWILRDKVSRTVFKDAEGNTLTFENKGEAKIIRDASEVPLVVSRGPDHPKW